MRLKVNVWDKIESLRLKGGERGGGVRLVFGDIGFLGIFGLFYLDIVSKRKKKGGGNKDLIGRYRVSIKLISDPPFKGGWEKDKIYIIKI